MTDQATMEETKHDKFVRIRDMRMPKAVHAIELLGNLGSHHYEFTPEEARALVDELDAAVATVADALGIPHRQVTPSDALPPEASIVADEGAEEGEELPEEGQEDEEAASAPSGRARKTPERRPFPEDLSKAEADELHRIGAEHDRAINAIQDGNGQEALRILLGLTTA